MSTMPPARDRSAVARWPAGLDPVVLGALALGFVALLVPLFWSFDGRWEGTQGHELAIFAVSAFLLYRKRHALAAIASPAAPRAGGLLFVLGLLMYVFGRAHDVRLALIALMVLAAAVLLCFKGTAALRMSWFAILFPLFALPLPLEFVLAVTGPMKIGVSYVAAQLLSWAGYPIGRSGVVLTVGQYQLLVTEACAGLQTMFTLEAMGLLYASLMNHSSALRNLLLAILVVPIAFFANVVRVAVLALITYYFGDAAGQGFLHGFSGVVLFLVALALVIAVDALLGRLLAARDGRA
jgi:exosortase B